MTTNKNNQSVSANQSADLSQFSQATKYNGFSKNNSLFTKFLTLDITNGDKVKTLYFAFNKCDFKDSILSSNIAEHISHSMDAKGKIKEGKKLISFDVNLKKTEFVLINHALIKNDVCVSNLMLRQYFNEIPSLNDAKSMLKKYSAASIIPLILCTMLTGKEGNELPFSDKETNNDHSNNIKAVYDIKLTRSEVQYLVELLPYMRMTETSVMIWEKVINLMADTIK